MVEAQRFRGTDAMAWWQYLIAGYATYFIIGTVIGTEWLARQLKATAR
jgi:uncharacterized membrane protein